MIVRCKNCNSAFAVNDGKVDNKKFAFTCPKCTTENIIDNRQGMDVAAGGSAPPITDSSSTTTMPSDSQTPDTSQTIMDSSSDDSLESESINSIDSDENLMTEDETKDLLSEDDENLTLDLDADLNMDFSIDEEKKVEDSSDDIPPIEDNLSIDLDTELEGLDSLEDITGDDLEDDETTKGETKDLSMTNEDLDMGMATSSDASDVENLDLSFDENDSIDEKEFSEDSLDLDFEEAIFEEAELSSVPEDSQPGSDVSITVAEADEPFVLDEFEPVEEDLLYDKNDTQSVEIKDEIESESEDEEELLLDDDESITIDLDSLDIEFEEDDRKVNADEVSVEDDFSEIDTSLNLETEEKSTEDENLFDEDITLDLDSLDIPLAEEEEIKEGEKPDDDDFDEEDEKLTLEDAGLTFDELSSEEKTNSIDDSMLDDDDDEEDIKLTIDEIDPNLNVDNLENELKGESSSGMNFAGDSLSTDQSDIDELQKELLEAEDILSKDDDFADLDLSDLSDNDLPDINLDDYDDLPDIDLDIDLDDDQSSESGIVLAAAGSGAGQNKIDDDLDNNLMYFDDDYSSGVDKKISEMKVKGALNLSIDYSLRYSRLGGVAKIFGVFFLGLIPHFIVSLVYSLLSFILGLLNHIIVISTGEAVEDFQNIQENSMRHVISIAANSIGIVEEWPIFAGKENIDHPLQVNVTYTLKNSRVLAFLRLSILGIFIILLPHLLILEILSLALRFFFLAGIISVIITARYPHMLFDFFVRYFRYLSRIMAFSSGIIDEYPHFKFD
jgi:hypothetical protein